MGRLSIPRKINLRQLGLLLLACVGIALAIIATVLANPTLAFWSIIVLVLLASLVGLTILKVTHARGTSLAKILNMQKTVKDTAGSVGRSAPLVRRVDANVSQLLKVAGEAVELANRQSDILGRIDARLGTLGSNSSSSSESSAGASRPAEPLFKSDIARVSRNRRELPEVTARANNYPPPRLKVAVVLDEFSLEAFRPEWMQYEVNPDDWRSKLDAIPFDLLFVESAWAGNGGAWQYQLTGSRAPRKAITEMVAAFRMRNIPTVFWNKEDPPHFEDFLRTAALFDWVFTTDENCVPGYKDALGHDRVGVLPFAAQPALHNPIKEKGLPRDRSITFGGMYFAHKYPERRQQMDYLLPAASEFGLDIFSRHAGGDKKYAFPGALESDVVGAISYPKMLAAYKAYKVVLNVNSVVNSPSMCARRIFEATACGASVVTPASKAIPSFFSSDEIHVVNDAVETRNSLRALLRSEEYRARVVHRGQRRVLQEHTYGHRVDNLSHAVGLKVSSPRTARPSVSIVCSSIRPQLLTNLIKTISCQTEKPLQVIINLHGIEADTTELQRLATRSGVTGVQFVSNPREKSLGSCLNEMVEMAEGDVVYKFDDDDYYGPNYIRDMLNSFLYSGADIVGKAASFIHFEGMGATILTMPNSSQKFVEFVRGSTIVARRTVLQEIQFGDSNAGEDSSLLSRAQSSGARIFASDKYNYCVIRNAHGWDHTWLADDMALMGTGEVVGFGDYQSLVTV